MKAQRSSEGGATSAMKDDAKVMRPSGNGESRRNKVDGDECSIGRRFSVEGRRWSGGNEFFG